MTNKFLPPKSRKYYAKYNRLGTILNIYWIIDWIQMLYDLTYMWSLQ